MDHTMRIIWNS